MGRRTRVLLTAWSAGLLLLVLADVVVSLGNQSIRTEVGERQQEITQTIQLEAFNRQLITVLANMALKTNDEQLKKVLTESGVRLDQAPPKEPTKK